MSLGLKNASKPGRSGEKALLCAANPSKQALLELESYFQRALPHESKARGEYCGLGR